MSDPAPLFVLATASTFAVAIAVAAALKGWQGWLELKRQELGGRGNTRGSVPQRVELADLKERVRRLEAIADGAED